jgi:SEC-C motif
MRIGRNDPCHCKSGLKYKKCCGNPLKGEAFAQIPPAVLAELKRREAAELIRRQQQGLGKPIVSMNMNGYQFVAAGNTLYWSPKWKTFADFLASYMARILGDDWGNAELAKPPHKRHPIMQWREEYCHFQHQHFSQGEIQSGPATGIVKCYLGLAYSLYLIKHNVELQDRLVRRLKNVGQFQGAYYELLVANCLIRAGFKLDLEDETDGAVKHCEFSAVSPTGKKYWVEAKMRSFVGLLGKTEHDGTSRADPISEIVKHLNGAFAKPAADERLIFVDVNTNPHPNPKKGIFPEWTDRAERRLDKYEKQQLKPGQNAYVIITNMAFHRALQEVEAGFAIVPHGLGNDFCRREPRRLSDEYRLRQKHIDIHNLCAACAKYPQIPNTFDGCMPSEKLGKGPPVKIGEAYFFDCLGHKRQLGTVTSATVSESEKKIYYTVSAEDGTNHQLFGPLSDEGVADYRAHPEAYFGVVQPVAKRTDSPYELFEFFLNGLKAISKQKLLQSMQSAPDIHVLRKMEQTDLAIEIAERRVANFLQRSPQP